MCVYLQEFVKILEQRVHLKDTISQRGTAATKLWRAGLSPREALASLPSKTQVRADLIGPPSKIVAVPKRSAMDLTDRTATWDGP
jgi:hypothetical protein